MAHSNSPQLGSLPSSSNRWPYIGFISMAIFTFCSIVVLDASIISMFSTHILSFKEHKGFFNLATFLAWTSMGFICVLIPVFLVLVFLVGLMQRKTEDFAAGTSVQESQV